MLLILRDRARHERSVAKADAIAAHRTAAVGKGAAAGYERGSIAGDGSTAVWINAIREQYDLTNHGFLPAQALKPLADKRFAPWEALERALPIHSAAGTLHAAIGKLPLLDATLLTEVSDLRRAYLVKKSTRTACTPFIAALFFFEINFGTIVIICCYYYYYYYYYYIYRHNF